MHLQRQQNKKKTKSWEPRVQEEDYLVDQSKARKTIVSKKETRDSLTTSSRSMNDNYVSYFLCLISRMRDRKRKEVHPLLYQTWLSLPILRIPMHFLIPVLSQEKPQQFPSFFSFFPPPPVAQPP